MSYAQGICSLSFTRHSWYTRQFTQVLCRHIPLWISALNTEVLKTSERSSLTKPLCTYRSASPRCPCPSPMTGAGAMSFSPVHHRHLDLAAIWGHRELHRGNVPNSERAWFSLEARHMRPISRLCDGLRPKGKFLQHSDWPVRKGCERGKANGGVSTGFWKAPL